MERITKSSEIWPGYNPRAFSRSNGLAFIPNERSRSTHSLNQQISNSRRDQGNRARSAMARGMGGGMSGRRGGGGFNFARPYGGGGGEGGGFGTGPLQHGKRPGEFDGDPSQDSLTRARFNQFDDYINNLNNAGAGARLEDAAGFARSAAAEQVTQSGIDPNSLQGAMLVANTQANAMDSAFSREAELDAQLKRDQTRLKGQIAQMEQSRGNDLFDRYMGDERLNLDRQRQDFAESQAALQNFLQFFNSPRAAELFASLGGSV